MTRHGTEPWWRTLLAGLIMLGAFLGTVLLVSGLGRRAFEAVSDLPDAVVPGVFVPAVQPPAEDRHRRAR